MKIKSVVAIIAAFIVVTAGLTAGISAYLLMTGNYNPTVEFMSSFSNYDDLKGYLDDAFAKAYGPNGTGYYYGFGIGGSPEQDESTNGAPYRSIDYSKTNVQVEGVDEADIVKTNGELIFVSSYNSLAIIKAYPPDELHILSYLNTSDFIDDSSSRAAIQGLYINENKLILILTCYKIYNYNDTQSGSPDFYEYEYYSWVGNTAIAVFDISDPVNPSLEQIVGMSGYPLTSRMIGNTVYSITYSYICKMNDTYPLPEVIVGESSSELSARDIYYDPETSLPSSFLNILAVDVRNLKDNHLTIMADYSSTVYMSESALYLTILKWKEYYWLTPDTNTTSADESICSTTIYKIKVDKLWMAVTARGDVKGYPLNQFSLDEHDGYLRVATTDGFWGAQTNAVYVLDNDLEIVGSLEGIAPNERIYSSRFVGDVLYLVTFRQTDPLFVIDLSDSRNPRILGEIELPGFSTYLHPIDDEHVLGIGIENGHVRISVFDVSDPTAPAEKFKYVTEGSSYSEANWDHKAILFDARKGLLVIPATEYNYSVIDEYNYTYWRTCGAYVFNVSLSKGIELRGIISHDFSDVRRALYIGEYLYTISECFVKINLLSDLSPIGSLQYYSPGDNGYWYCYGSRID